jgi:hypothetical protein
LDFCRAYETEACGLLENLLAANFVFYSPIDDAIHREACLEMLAGDGGEGDLL